MSPAFAEYTMLSDVFLFNLSLTDTRTPSITTRPRCVVDSANTLKVNPPPVLGC